MRRGVERAESSCPGDTVLAELMDGRLPAEELSRLHLHSEQCAACHELLVTLVRGGPRREESTEVAPEPLADGWTPPAEFDEFRLLRPLGRGAMGVVYLAHDRSLDRQVAVKFIATPRPDARARERFQTEARAIARLRHPNAVTVFRVGEAGQHPYIVSEYLEGHSLADMSLPLPWRRVLSLGIGLARAIAAAHRQGVLHRDIKPANIFLTAEGEVKLLDFGLAELVEAGTSPAPSAERAAAGTPRYMAPELFRGVSATPRSDLYALGVVLYELCTGELPPQARRSPLSPRRPPAEAGPGQPLEPASLPPLTRQVPGIDPDFASLIERCLRIDPDDRFTSAEALCAGLERLELPHAPDVLSAGNPYRGLAPFEAEHRELFFGRDADIRALLERLRRQPLVLIAGDSGAGKSSLCRAGILPRAARGAIDEYRDFTTLTLEPGRRPLSALAAALAPILGQPEAWLGARLAEAPEELGPMLRAAHQEGRGLLLFVDQLEELVTLSEPDQAARFARFLGELALPGAGVRVLLAVRGDFLMRVSALPGLRGVAERMLYLLQPLTSEGVREAIVGPARSRGVVFESEELLQTLTKAAARRAGSLPLLQFALAELWERRDPARGTLTRAALDEMGGVAGALSRHADSVLARMSPAGQQAARRLLGRLITAEGTRGERSEAELTGGSEEGRTALHALVEGRLLHARTTGSAATYEIAHEALIASWGTLRQWLDEDAGQRALRQRIEAASTEWERLGRAEELLWRGRQLEESRALDLSSLGAREQGFLRASRRAVRRQRLRRGLFALLLVLAAGALAAGPRLQAHLELQPFIHARLQEAQAALTRANELGQSASASRERALALFNGQPPDGSSAPLEAGELRSRAEEAWSQALDELKQADATHAAAERALMEILGRVHDHAGAQQLLIQLTYERITLAERFHRENERAWHVERFMQLTTNAPQWRERLEAPASLVIETEPPGARVELTRYVAVQGVLRREPVPGHGTPGLTPTTHTLKAGSYHLRLTREGHPPVDLPILLERGGHERVHLVLPASVPEGYAYIPPGCFFAGTADPEGMREFMHSVPLHRRCLQEGYLIGRHEVTLGEWLDYLNALPPGAPERRLLETPRRDNSNTALTLRQLPDGTWSFSFYLMDGTVLTSREGEPIRYPGRGHRQEQDWRRFPLAGVSAEDVAGYFSWLDRTRRLPGARLCDELEWVRAASGADDRRYPHGDRLQKDDANIDVTYGRKLDAFGPDEVGSHPASVSPFGLHDMAGNVFELVRSSNLDLSVFVILGGAWYYDGVSTLIANRQAGTSTLRDMRVGLRVCASMPLQ